MKLQKSRKPSKINGLRRFERKCKKYEKQDKSANGLPRQYLPLNNGRIRLYPHGKAAPYGAFI